jgi:hypothetical protein
MPNRQRNIQARIASLVDVPASSLVSVPTERDRPEDAVRKLQVQCFELADAIADLVQEVDSLRAQVTRGSSLGRG